jgi:hypothetical protein
MRVKGKLIRRSLKTKTFSVAKLRLADLEKMQRKRANPLTAVLQGKMTLPHWQPSTSKNTRKNKLRCPNPTSLERLLRRSGILEVVLKNLLETWWNFWLTGAFAKQKHKTSLEPIVTLHGEKSS